MKLKMPVIWERYLDYNLDRKAEKNFSRLQRYILELAVYYSTGNYKDGGIYEDALVDKVFESHLYQLSDDDRQKNIPKNKAYFRIRRCIFGLELRGYLKIKKAPDGRKVVLSTNKSNRWFKNQFR